MCRMPESSVTTKWVKCSICNDWFHPTCIQIPRQAIEKGVLLGTAQIVAVANETKTVPDC